MSSKFLSSLSSIEYTQLCQKLAEIQHGKCFICGEPIDCHFQEPNIDHIIPLANRGKDDPSNFALTHASCNKSKQDADLEVARVLHKLKNIQDEVEKEERRAASLKDLLKAVGGSQYDFQYRIEQNDLIYGFDKIKDTSIKKAPIFTDPLSQEKFCFIEVPIEYLFHDEIINPRGINSSISLLVKEFHKKNPQLHLTLARIDGNKIRVFDGQHKAAAQILLGNKIICLRLFINPNVEKLTETNANAGSKLRQIAFDKAVMRQLNNTLYLERVKKYQEDHNLSPDDYSFSEVQLCDYFKGENIKKYIIDALKSSITYSAENKLKDFIDFEGKGKSLPLSHSTFDKVFLSQFVDAKTILTTPINYKNEQGLNPRELEISQISHLMSIIAERIYIGKFNPETGMNRIEQRILDGRDTDISNNHLIAYRIGKEEIVHEWVPYLLKVISMYFLNQSINYRENNIFQTRFPDQLWHNLDRFIQNLTALPLWQDRSMAGSHFSGKKNYEFWKQVFSNGRTPDGVQIMMSGINYVEMIK